MTVRGASGVAIIGGGPAGLMAADVLSAHGVPVTVIERMPSAGRKFLMAGRGGLNLTHSEEIDWFLSRYGPDRAWLEPVIRSFGPDDLRAWAQGLGQATFVGSSGRVFPAAFKASPLLRAWLARLQARDVVLRTRTRWLGWNADGGVRIEGSGGLETLRPAATLLALGGASWPRLGSDGAWMHVLKEEGVAVSPLRPANAGICADWSEPLRAHAGTPLKRIALTLDGASVRGEAMVTEQGLEGGAVYALSRSLQQAFDRDGVVRLTLDLRPDLDQAELTRRLSRTRGRQSASTFLRKAAGLSPCAIAVMREAGSLPSDPVQLAARMKAVPLSFSGMMPIGHAISSAGGIQGNALDADFMLRARPGVFAAGEMLDWDAPTGGYLLQATFATAVAAAKGMLRYLEKRDTARG